MKALQDKLYQLGSQLVKCRFNCRGIVNDPEKGILPRCLFYENFDSRAAGIVIVGINPGRSGQEEQDYYRQQGLSYPSQLDYWNRSVSGGRYYAYLRNFAETAGYKGPVLWTELVKCENDANTLFPPVETIRTCSRNYLQHELEMVPESWTILAIGKEVYKSAALLYPGRSVLGIPHPNSRGYFASLFKDSKRKELLAEVKHAIERFNDQPGEALWLSTNQRKNQKL